MLGLITDRTQQNVARRNELSRKGWSNMTTAERNEWEGKPIETLGANILPIGEYYSSVVSVEHNLTEIVATASTDGTYLYAVTVIGAAADYANKKFTLSIDSITSTQGGVPRFALFWHSDDGNSDYAGGSLFNAGSTTFDTTEWPNVNNRTHLAAYVYVTTTTPVTAGAEVRFKGVMLERGDTRHEYAPYTEIAPTAVTKGAYNYSDLNRVERIVAMISSAKGLNLTTKTNWTMWEIPKASDMSRYLSNIKTIRTSIGSSVTLPDSMNNLSYTDANNIEQILTDAMEGIT